VGEDDASHVMARQDRDFPAGEVWAGSIMLRPEAESREDDSHCAMWRSSGRISKASGREDKVH
jgi:hypothetical protein